MVLVEGALTFGWEFRDRATKEVFASDLIGGTTTEATITIEVELARGAKTRLTHTKKCNERRGWTIHSPQVLGARHRSVCDFLAERKGNA